MAGEASPTDWFGSAHCRQILQLATVESRNISTIVIEVSIVNNQEQLPEFMTGGAEHGNSLFQYVQSLSPETIAQLSKPTSTEVFQVMERNIVGLLGALPSEGFNITVTTSREDLGRLLASAMMSGYFLRNAEQRMAFEKSFAIGESDLAE